MSYTGRTPTGTRGAMLNVYQSAGGADARTICTCFIAGLLKNSVINQLLCSTVPIVVTISFFNSDDEQ
jgi:hypothetical protein